MNLQLNSVKQKLTTSAHLIGHFLITNLMMPVGAVLLGFELYTLWFKKQQLQNTFNTTALIVGVTKNVINYGGFKMVTVTKRSSKKTKNRQTLTAGVRYDRDADVKRKAKAPGVRTAKSGKRYTERRRNRSDVPPGRL